MACPIHTIGRASPIDFPFSIRRSLDDRTRKGTTVPTIASLPAAVVDHLRAHHGVAAVETFVHLGVSPTQVRRMTEAGLLERVHRQVYIIRSSPLTFMARCVAACAAHPDLVITGLSAGRIWELRKLGLPLEPPAGEVLTATAPVRGAPSLSGVRIRRSNDLRLSDLVRRDDGIRVATPARTWFDLGAQVGDRAFESITEQVIDRYCTVPTLWATRRRLAGRGRDGAARVNRVLDARPAWHKPADSDLEVRVLRALRDRGLDLVPQHRLALRNGSVAFIDAADPLLRWGVEVDHVTWHGGRFDAQADKARDRQAGLLGWRIERVTDDEVARNLEAVADELIELRQQWARSTAA